MDTFFVAYVPATQNVRGLFRLEDNARVEAEKMARDQHQTAYILRCVGAVECVSSFRDVSVAAVLQADLVLDKAVEPALDAELEEALSD